MSLTRAQIGNDAVPLADQPSPIPAQNLGPLVGQHFTLPCEDDWLQGSGDEGHAYLDGAKRAWEEWPEWMDFLDPESPAWALKTAERDLYLWWWQEWLDAERVLDIGCGIGRFVTPMLDRGATVIGVDGDLDSLRRCAWHSAGRPGALDLHWSSVSALPEIAPVDLVIACEVLCYVPDVKAALAELVARLRIGGALLISVEARYGWAAAADAPQDTVHCCLEDDWDGVIDLPGDRWVQTYSRQQLHDVLTEAGLDVRLIQPTHYITDGPLEKVAPEELGLSDLLRWEEHLREHPVYGQLNRAWTAIAVREA